MEKYQKGRKGNDRGDVNLIFDRNIRPFYYAHFIYMVKSNSTTRCSGRGNGAKGVVFCAPSREKCFSCSRIERFEVKKDFSQNYTSSCLLFLSTWNRFSLRDREAKRIEFTREIRSVCWKVFKIISRVWPTHTIKNSSRTEIPNLINENFFHHKNGNYFGLFRRNRKHQSSIPRRAKCFSKSG